MSVDYFTRVQASPGWARILESFTRFAGPQPGQRTLDVGCGPGLMVRQWAALGCQAVGVDIDPAMIERACALANAAPAGAGSADFRQGSALALPFGEGEFDIVTAANVLFLLPEPLAGVREMVRVCRPGGSVVMLNPSPGLSRASAAAHAAAHGLQGFEAESLVTWAGVAERHHRLNRAAVQDLLLATGLQPEAIEEKIGPGFAIFARGRKPLSS